MLTLLGLIVFIIWLLGVFVYSAPWPIHIFLLATIIVLLGKTKKRKTSPGGTEKFLG